MEAIKINIEVGFNAASLEVLSRLVDALKTNASATAAPAPSAPKKPAKPISQPEPEKPKTIGADPIGTGTEDVDDLPPDDAPDPAPKPEPKTPTEADARNAVAAAKKRGVTAAAIKSYMKTAFDISSSVECPAERRQELIDGLNKLAA